MAELVAGLVAEGVLVARGEATSLVTQASYAAWRDVWVDLLGLGPDRAGAGEVVRAVGRLDPRLVGRAPLLGPLLGVALPDSALTASFDGELRKTSLEDLLAPTARGARRRGRPRAGLEDAHWLDPLSRDLLELAARATAG